MRPVIKKPEITKKRSTPMNPPGQLSRKAGKATTSSTATARRPSISGRYLSEGSDNIGRSVSFLAVRWRRAARPAGGHRLAALSLHASRRAPLARAQTEPKIAPRKGQNRGTNREFCRLQNRPLRGLKNSPKTLFIQDLTNSYFALGAWRLSWQKYKRSAPCSARARSEEHTSELQSQFHLV